MDSLTMRRGRWPTAGIGYKMNNQRPTTSVHEGHGRAQEGHTVEGHGADSGSEKGKGAGGGWESSDVEEWTKAAAFF